jgi:MazG family protein
MRHKPPRFLARGQTHIALAHPHPVNWQINPKGEKRLMPQKKKMPAKHRTKKRIKVSPSARARIFVSARDELAGSWFAKLVALQARLRAPNGCPWDREQTHESLRKFLIEETYEVLDAMDSDDPRKFSSELGDLLLQVVFHANLAEASGRFTISDVIESVHEKMIRRHPHVFGRAKASTPAAVLKNWEQIKADERAAERAAKGQAIAPPATKSVANESILSGVPHSLPGALEAYQLTRRASRVGFDWDNLAGIFDKLDEERREIESSLPSATGKSALHLEEEVGDLLFASVNIARFLGVDPEIALKGANRKFKKRFQWMESAAAKEGHRFADLPRARMEELWDQSKVQA